MHAAAVQAIFPYPLSTHIPPEHTVSLRQPNMLDGNPRAVPASGLGCLLSCNPVGAGAGPVHYRGLVSLSLGAATEAGSFPGWCGHGRGSAASCCCREVAVGPGPGGLAGVSPSTSVICPQWGPLGLDSLCRHCQLCRAFLQLCFSGKTPFPSGKILDKGVLPSVSERWFQARMSVAAALAGAGTGFVPGEGTGLFLQSCAGCLLVSHGSCFSWMQAHPDRIQILMAVVRYKTQLSKPRRGLCSTWLASLNPEQGNCLDSVRTLCACHSTQH